MLVQDHVLSEVEIDYLDSILSEISIENQFRSLHTFYKEWSLLECIDESGALEMLRVKGVFNIEHRTKTIVKHDNAGIERVTDTTIEIGTLQTRELLTCWLATIYFRSGKQIQLHDLANITSDSACFLFPILVGNETVNIKFVTKELDETLLTKSDHNSIFVSFIGDLPISEQSYIHWFDPLQELSAAARFFNWINEQSKPLSSKQYITIDLPTDLEKTSLEHIYSLLKLNLTELGYERVNKPDEYKPESIDYFFPEQSIRNCFINRDKHKKVFIIYTEHKIELHSFESGIKSLDPDLNFHVIKFQTWVDKKIKKFRDIEFIRKSTLITDLSKYVPMIVAITISLFSSLSLIFSEIEIFQQFSKNTWWITLQVFLNIVSILVIIYIGLIPQILHRFFSWDRFFIRYVKKNK